jgi:hypothetical protein
MESSRTGEDMGDKRVKYRQERAAFHGLVRAGHLRAEALENEMRRSADAIRRI